MRRAALLLALLLLPDLANAQTLRVRLLRFEVAADGDTALAETLRKHLVDGLNARSRPRFEAFLEENEPRDGASSAESAGAYSVSVRITRVSNRDHLTVMVANPAGRHHAEFEVVNAERPALLRDALDQLALVLATNIRIGVADFHRAGGDSVQFHGLVRTLPNMLITRLSGSPHLALIELNDAEQLSEIRTAGGTPAGTPDHATALELGRLKAANYVLFGDFLALDDQLRIDVRCVSLETGEIVATEGVIIQPIALATIEREMARIAAEIRTAVENDFVAPVNATLPVAVGGFPPSPDSYRNRNVQEALIRATRAKLSALQIPWIVIRDDASFDTEMVHQRLDPWVMSARMQARYLFTLSLRRHNPDTLGITIDFYDTANLGVPAQEHRTVFIEDVDTALDGMIAELLTKKLELDSMPSVSRARYVHPLPLLEFFVGFGAVRWTDPGLFLNSSGAVALEGGVGYRLRDPLQLRFTLRFEPFASSGSTRRAYGGHALAGITWDMHPLRSRSLFVGGLLGTAGILRTSDNGVGYNSATALGAYVGYRMYWWRQVPWSVRLEAMHTLTTIHGQTIGGTSFPGGRPGGIYLLISTAL